jgi:hypothetical protein
LDLLEKVRGVGGQPERSIIRRAADRKVLGDILIRVPIAIRADHPNFFAAELVAQGVQDTHLIGEAVDSLPPLGVGFEYSLTPVLPDDPVGPENLKQLKYLTLAMAASMLERCLNLLMLRS